MKPTAAQPTADKPAAADWPELLQLLDSALQLDDTQLPAWMATLQPERRQQLQALLDQRRAINTRQFLAAPAPLPGAAPQADAVAQPGQRVGPWRLLHEIGHGGMAWVWLAERADGQGQRRVALKLPRLGWAPGLAERMARERDILATLEHPNIARLYDAGLDEQGRPWLALEHVQGLPIDRHCAERGLAVHARVALLLQALEALAHAHDKQVLHRDLKPGNVLVTSDGSVRLLDFGIAKLMAGDTAEPSALTRASGRALTPEYASPEQIMAQPLGPASDLYSMAVLAYQVLTGQRPYRLRRGTAAELEEAIASAQVLAPSRVALDTTTRRALRGDLDAVLLKALQREPARRYASAHLLAQDLRHVLQGQPVSAAPDSWWYRGRKLVQRRPLESALVAALVIAVPAGAAAQVAVLLALGAGTAATLWQARRAREQARAAQHQARRAEQVKALMLDLFRNTALESGSVPDTPVSRLLADAAERLERNAEVPPDVRDEMRLVIAGSLLDFGAPAEALPIARRALASIESREPPDANALADGLYATIEGLALLTRWDEALALAERSLALPCDARRWVQLRSHMAHVMHGTGRVREGLRFAQEAAARADAEPEAVGPLRHLHAYHRLTFAHKSSGVPGALPAARRMVALAEAVYGQGPVAPLLLHRIHLAAAMVSEGDAIEGVQMFRALVAQLDEVLGPDQPRQLVHLNWLLLAEHSIGDTAAAIRTQEAVFARAAFARDPPTARSSHHFVYARLLHTVGRDEEALQQIAIAADLVGQGGAALVARRRNILAYRALLLLRSGQSEQAHALIAELPDAVEAWPLTVSKVWLAALKLAQGRRGDAIAALHAAIATLMAEPPLVSALAIAQAAAVAFDADEPQQALLWGQEAMARLNTAQLESSPVAADLHALLGRVQLRLGQHDEARRLLVQARRRWALFDPAHPRLAQLDRELATLAA
jgi:eukaryotic-like serine/threonine-protein kinase